MGSKEEDVPIEPIQKATFIEDMNEDELTSAVLTFFLIEKNYCCMLSHSLMLYS